ncbi:MAG: hypothetical protein ABI740_01395 [Alphaproteobacteria bacterium]
MRAKLTLRLLISYLSGMTGWAILAAELRIPWESAFAAHRLIVVANPDDDAARQLNGLASWLDRGAAAWRHKPIGYLPTDRLRGYDTHAHRQTWMPINGVASGSWRLTPAIATGAARVLADGLSEADVAARLAPALEAMKRINALSVGPEGGAGLPYPFLGFGRNSNSFFSTLLAAMEFDEPTFARPAFLAPGAGSLLLPQSALDEIRARYPFGVDGGTSGARNPVISAAIASTPSAVG